MPPDWQLAKSVRAHETKIGIGLLAILVLRMGWVLTSDWMVSSGIAGTLGRGTKRLTRARRFLAWRPTAVGTAVLSLAAVLSLSGLNRLLEWTVAAAILAGMLVAHQAAPRFVSGGEGIRHETFVPASVLTILLLVVGVGFAPPPPIADPDDEVPRNARRAGSAALGVIVLTVLRHRLAHRGAAVPCRGSWWPDHRVVGAYARRAVGRSPTGSVPCDRGGVDDLLGCVDWPLGGHGHLITGQMTAARAGDHGWSPTSKG